MVHSVETNTQLVNLKFLFGYVGLHDLNMIWINFMHIIKLFVDVFW